MAWAQKHHQEITLAYALGKPQMKTDFSHPQYRLDKYGRLWFGPTNPDSTMHYAYWDGFDAEKKPIWILARTDEPPISVSISMRDALSIIRAK